MAKGQEIIMDIYKSAKNRLVHESDLFKKRVTVEYWYFSLEWNFKYCVYLCVHMHVFPTACDSAIIYF